MRRALLLVVLVACSKSDDKAKPGSQPAPGGGTGSEPAAAPGKAEKTVKGSLTLGGALTATVSSQPDLSLTCACLSEKEFAVDVTMTDGKGLFTAIALNTAKGMSLTSAKLPNAAMLHAPPGAGMSGGCKPDNRNTDGVISIDIDGKVTGESEVTVKGHLDVVCRDGL